ncbi:MAG TPA: hypothetical protein VNO55_08490 [Polyangia bacterium]|nr:hypothetical protein [Polyangia bacterium]
MADPKWVDSSTIGNVAAGDTALRAELMQLRMQGTPLLIVPKVKEEITVGNPFPAGPMAQQKATTAQLCQQVLVDLDIKVDMMGSEADRRDFFEKQFKFKPKGPSPVVRAMEESDAIILSQIAASAKARGISSPTFFTADGRLFRNADAKNWGVSLTMRQSRPLVAGIGVAPGLPGGTPGMNSGKANIVLAGVLVVGTLLNWLSDILTEQRIRKDLSDTEDWIRKQQRTDPHMGILVVVELWQTVPIEPSGYWPAPSYQGTTLIYGVNRPTAEANLRREWSGVPPTAKRIFRMAWIPPLQTAPPKPSVDPSKQAPWLKRYQLVKNAVDPPADYTEALHILNGSSMYDIVNSLRMLASDRSATFSGLWQQLDGNVPAFLRTRLPPAFSAASDVTWGTGSVDFYKARVGDSFWRLSSDDQKSIIDFLGQFGKKAR